MEVNYNNLLFGLGIITATWFLLNGIVWIYYFALIFAYPIGVISLLIWLKIRKDKKSRNKLIPTILLIGLISSLSTLIYLFIFD